MTERDALSGATEEELVPDEPVRPLIPVPVQRAVALTCLLLLLLGSCARAALTSEPSYAPATGSLR